MACCFPDSHAEAPQPCITKPVDEQSPAACGSQAGYNGVSPSSKNIFASTSGEYMVDDELLDTCLEYYIDATRSGVCTCDGEDMISPVASQVGTPMLKQFSPHRGEANQLMPLTNDFTNAVDRGNLAEQGEKHHQSFPILKKRDLLSMPPPPYGGNIHQIPCSPSVALQIQESFTTFRKELSSDFLDWKQALSSELRLLVQGLQVSDKTHTTLPAKVCRQSWDSGSAPSWKPELLAPRWSDTEEAAQHWKAELTLFEKKRHRFDIRRDFGTDSTEFVGATKTGSSGIASAARESSMDWSLRSELGKQHLPEHIALLLRWPQTASDSSTTQIRGKLSWLFKTKYVSTGAAPRVTLFGNMDSLLKDSWNESCKPYDVETLYHASGIAQYVARSKGFHGLTLIMICLSAVYMGVETDRSDCNKLMDANWKYQVPEHVLSSFFTFEILIRFGAFVRKCDCLGDIWFVIDCLLVVHMLIETYVLSLVLPNEASSEELGFIRCVRLLRIARFSRLMRVSPEMVTMMKAMYAGTKAIGSAVMLVLVLIYAFALALCIINGESGCAQFQNATGTARVHSAISPDNSLSVYFGDVPRGMWTLLVQGIFMDGIGDLFDALREKQASFSICLLLLFVALSSFVVLNMLLGIFCEVVSKVAEAEEEHATRSRLREALSALLHRADRDSKGSLNKDEFLQFFGDPEAVASFHEHDINACYVMDMTEMLFPEAESEVPIVVVMELLLKHRTDRPCRTGDIIGAMQCQRFWTDRAQQRMLAEMKRCLEEQAARASEHRSTSLALRIPTVPEDTRTPESWTEQHTFNAMSSVLEA